MRGRARRLLLLRYGAELVPKSLSVAGEADTLFWSPITGVLVETHEGWVLFDSGMRRANHDSTAVDDVYRLPGTDDPAALPTFLAEPDPGRWTWGRPGDPLVTALAEVGLTVGELSLAVISHLHWDHAGGIGTLAEAGVPVVMHADEVAFARSTAPRLEEGFDRADWAPLQDRWTEVTGDTEIAPGVVVLATPGHTPGHVSLQVDLPDTGTWLFPADAAELAQNVIDRRPCGSTTGTPPGQAEESLRKLLDLAAETRARVVGGHDPVVTHAAGHPPGGHR
jgi:glyoxylase-like metal-dependent hydrolase (beta-lactamase superfamily II)